MFYLSARDVEEKTHIKIVVLENMHSTDCNTSLYLKCTDLQLVLMDQTKLNCYHGFYSNLFFIHFSLLIFFSNYSLTNETI